MRTIEDIKKDAEHWIARVNNIISFVNVELDDMPSEELNGYAALVDECTNNIIRCINEIEEHKRGR